MWFGPPSGSREIDGGRSEKSRVGVIQMRDLIFVACTIGFFLVAIAYVWACDRLK